MAPDESAWQAAYQGAGRAGISIRSLSRREDVDGVLAVIEAVWGAEVMPPALLRAFQQAGSCLYGAEAGDELVGFVLGFLGTAGGPHVHSHMLAVLPEWRRRGAGYALKLAQRAAALDEGIEEIRWTYDPLLAANARFNLNRLRAVATAYFPDFYGDMPDKLNRGDRSDRFEVTWWLRSRQVEEALQGRGLVVPAVLYPSLLDAEGPPDAPRPKETGVPVNGPVTVQIPADYQRLRQQNPALAEEWRQSSGRVFAECFEQGLEAELILQGRYWFSPKVPRPTYPR